MFGHRNDGIDMTKGLDPMVTFSSFIMPTRCESSNQIMYPAEYEPMAAFIRKKNSEGSQISFLTLLAAAYVRTVRKYPVMNYFVMGHRIYMHKDISICLIVLQNTEDGTIKEALAKVTFDPNDTLADVARKFDEGIAQAKKVDAKGGTSDFAGGLLRIPILPSLVVLFARITDRLGILPRALTNLSPFHCSMFITNMMSIGLPAITHHLYNFGTCSIFLSIGKPDRQTVSTGGKLTRRLVLPMGINTDERICGGAEYALGVHKFLEYLKKPERLELTPAEEDAI